MTPKIDGTFFSNILTYFSLICPDCLMFGKHVKHKVVSIPNAIKYLRLRIDTGVKEGKFVK